MLPKENIIKKLITSSKCEVCGRNYEVKNIDILGHEQEIWFLKIRCSACNHQSLVAAVVRENKIPPDSELTRSEQDKFRDSPAITSDDVLDMHNFLKKFKGDITGFFTPC